MRADRRAYWRWPVYSAMTMVLGVVLWSLLRKHVFPPEWESRGRACCCMAHWVCTR